MKHLPVRALSLTVVIVCLLTSLVAFHPLVRAQDEYPAEEATIDSSTDLHSDPYRPESLSITPTTTGFQASWTTRRPILASILYGPSPEVMSSSVRETGRRTTMHAITVESGDTYPIIYFTIVTPRGRYGLEGAPFKTAMGDFDTFSISNEGIERLRLNESSSVLVATPDAVENEPDAQFVDPSGTAEPIGQMPPLPVDALLSDGQFVYGPNAYDFDVAAYIEANQPRLVPHTGEIEEVAAMYSINPRVLLTILELNPAAADGQSSDFGIRLEQLAGVMVEAYYRHIHEISPLPTSSRTIPPLLTADGGSIAVASDTNAGSYGVLSALAATVDSASRDSGSPGGDFLVTYRRLFPDDDPLSQDNKVLIPGVVEAVPPAGTFQLPYRSGQAWTFSGAHYPGPSSTELASLDFWPVNTNLTQGWNAVVAATGGTFTRWPTTSTCQVEVRDQSGWAASYYHLESIPTDFNNGKAISQNTKIGLLADTYGEATCHGGSWPFAHVHFTLKYNGQFQDVNGAPLAHWYTRRGSNTAYSCSAFSFEKGTVNRTCGQWLLNHPDNDNTQISNGTLYNYSISPSRDSDRFSFYGQAGQKVQIWMTRTDSGNLDSLLRLYDSTDVLLVENNDYSGTDAYISYTLPKNDTYQIIAISASNKTTGAYQLKIIQQASCTYNADQVALFVDADYGGQCIVRGLGVYPNPAAIGLPNDAISSVKVGSNVILRLYEHDNNQGRTTSFTGNDPNLGNNTIGDNAVSSLRVERRYPANLALNRPVSATSQESSYTTPRMGNDGNTGTRWSSRHSSTSTSEWWIVDLGSVKTFDQVIIRWETAYAARHYVGWSNDGNNFTGWWVNISAPGNYRYFFGQRSARYLGVNMTQHAPCCGNYSFWEMEVYLVTRAGGQQAVVGPVVFGPDDIRIVPAGTNPETLQFIPTD